MQPLEFFAGVDWSSKEHQVCVLDLEGKVCGQRGFAHCGKGLHEMIDWIVNTTGAPAEKVGVVIETPRGPVVESLLGRGFVVHSINPKQMDRYRDRFSVAGAKDDRLDARVLAETARLDRSHLRAVDAQMPEVVQLRHCSRLCAQLNEDKVRLSNQLYHILWSYYPQFLELRVDLARTWGAGAADDGADATQSQTHACEHHSETVAQTSNPIPGCRNHQAVLEQYLSERCRRGH